MPSAGKDVDGRDVSVGRQAADVGQKTSDAASGRLPYRSERGSGAGHPLYRTTNSEYGHRAPCVHTAPLTYRPMSSKYWEQLANAGMYRNRSLNTAVDRSPV